MRHSQAAITVVGVAIIVLAASLLPVDRANASEDYRFSSGHFFSQSIASPGYGFVVRDDARDDAGRTMRFWSEYQRLGGVPVLGYPISRVYQDADGYYYQLFQRVLLQWRPELDAAVFANLLDKLSDAGADPWLAAKGIPPPISEDGSGGDFDAATRIRTGWLTQPAIRDYYLSASATGDRREAITRYGLPTSLPQRSGPFVVQRFQRIVLQLWVDRVQGMPVPGTVVPVLAGDLFREHSLSRGEGLADGRFTPEPGSPSVPRLPSNQAYVADGLRQPLALLAANPAGSNLAAALERPGVQVVFEDLNAIALFSPSRMAVSIDEEYSNADPKTLAAVLAHEASHLVDFVQGVDMVSTAGCYGTEYRAFQTQALVWSGFYGPAGKDRPANALDLELNKILFQVTHNAQAFAQEVATTYKSECGG